MPKPNLQSSVLHVERAASDIRRGVPVLLTQGKEKQLVWSAETVDVSTIRSGASLVLTAQRAKALGISAASKQGTVLLLDKKSIALLPKLIATQQDMPAVPEAKKLKTQKPDAFALAALELMKIAEIAPAALMQKASAAADALSVNTSELAAYEKSQAQHLKPVVEAPLTLRHAHQAKIVGFRAAGSGREHYAIVVGSPKKSGAPLARIHSSCYTGDLLASLKCDCRDQLQEAIHFMAENGGGVVLYLMQEGRGIGLINKLRAYHLQAKGMDTVEANEALGFEDDERPFFAASQMLKSLGFKSVRLMTNNPRKVKGLEACGIKVAERVDHVITPHEHNHEYLKTKFSRLGHVKKK